MLVKSKSEVHSVLGPVGTGGFRPRPAIGGGAARRLTAAMQAMETVGPIGPIEVPTPAHAVRLRRPVCLTATYVVACTALLVSVSLLPFGSGATAPVANARGDRERAGPVVERARHASEDPSFDSEPRLAGETRTLSDEKRRSDDEDLGSDALDVVRSAADASSSSSSTNADDSDPSCVFHVYRHLSKTGGTTVRFVFDRQTVFGDFEYPLEYGFDEGKWDALLTRWRTKADAYFTNDGAHASPPRTLVEIRGNWPSNWPAEAFATRILSDVERLRAEYGAGRSSFSGSQIEKNVSSGYSKTQTKTNRSCSVTTSLMLRDPARQYESFWRYYIEKRQQKKQTDVTKKWPDVDGAPFWGNSFAEWASRVPSMQIREVLGDKCVAQMRQPPFDATLDANNGSGWTRTGNHSFDKDACPYEVTERDFARFESLLERIDVVGVTERFDAFLLRLGETIGLRRLEYVKSNVKASVRRSVSVSETERERSVVADIARWDAKAHALARQRLDADVARDAEGGASGFARRLAAFEARTVVTSDGKTFVGGVPPRSPYVWVKSEDVKASGGALSPVVPSSFTDETGGGQAVAYIVFDPVTLTARDDAERVGAACVKGCTFDAPKT